MQGRRSRMPWITLLAALSAYGGFVSAHAGSPEPPGPPGDPTMIPIDQVDPRMPIYASMLPLHIEEPGSYYLAENITTSGGGIIVRSNEVTIDLMGFTLEGGTGPGIDGYGHFRLTVRNGTVRGWSGTGILTGGEAMLSDLTVADNLGSGMDIGMHSRAVGCTASGNSVHGIKAHTGSIVEGCVASNNGENGVWAESSFGVLISGCAVDFNSRNGIRIRDNTKVLDNQIRANDSSGAAGKAGIWVDGWNNHIEGNEIIENNIGIEVDGNQNVIVRNIVGNSLTDNFDVDPLAYGNLMPVFTMGSPGTPAPWDNIEHP